jgi:protein-S-isoprenylcysteine O-methyltransferase Ste14
MESRSTTLATRAAAGLLKLFLAVGLVLFLSAGSLDFWQAWVFLAALGVPALGITVHLLREDPALMESRLSGGPSAETRPRQKVIVALARLFWLLLLLVPALDHRFHSSRVPTALVFVGNAAVVTGGLFIVFLTFRANRFTSTVVEVTPTQQVASTGPYAIVRHPMYAGGIVFTAFMPIALGSCGVWRSSLLSSRRSSSGLWTKSSSFVPNFLATKLTAYKSTTA